MACCTTALIHSIKNTGIHRIYPSDSDPKPSGVLNRLHANKFGTRILCVSSVLKFSTVTEQKWFSRFPCPFHCYNDVLVFYFLTAYHCKCVDPWLTKTKKTCPVCKQKVVPSQGDSDSETDSSQEENEVSENTPLLRPLASVSTQSFGALAESHSRQNLTESSEYEEDDNDNGDSSDTERGTNEESVVVQLQPSEDREYRVANTV